MPAVLHNQPWRSVTRPGVPEEHEDEHRQPEAVEPNSLGSDLEPEEPAEEEQNRYQVEDRLPTRTEPVDCKQHATLLSQDRATPCGGTKKSVRHKTCSLKHPGALESASH